MAITSEWLKSKGFTELKGRTFEKMYGDVEGDYTAIGVMLDPKIKIYIRQQHKHGKFQLLGNIVTMPKLKTQYHIEMLWCMISGQRL